MALILPIRSQLDFRKKRSKRILSLLIIKVFKKKNKHTTRAAINHMTFAQKAIRSTTKLLCSVNELELELIQTQMAQKPMLRAEVGMRVRCANKASAE